MRQAGSSRVISSTKERPSRAGHGDIAEKKMRRNSREHCSASSAEYAALLGSHSSEYEGQGIGNQTIIINHQNSLHGPPFLKVVFISTENESSELSA